MRRLLLTFLVLPAPVLAGGWTWIEGVHSQEPAISQDLLRTLHDYFQQILLYLN